MRYLRVAASLLSLAPSVVLADENWVCLEENVTGFIYKDNQWQVTQFVGHKYVVRPLIEGDKDFNPSAPVTQYGVFQFGEDWPSYTCDDGFNLLSSGTYQSISVLNCDGFGQFRFDKGTLRFMRTYFAGYTYIPGSGKEEESDTPGIAIGTCSKIG
jgi:hypothetical protein